MSNTTNEVAEMAEKEYALRLEEAENRKERNALSKIYNLLEDWDPAELRYLLKRMCNDACAKQPIFKRHEYAYCRQQLNILLETMEDLQEEVMIEGEEELLKLCKTA